MRMRTMRLWVLGVLGAAMLAAPARANLQLDEMAAALALPFLAGPAVTTEIVVTNGLAEGITLQVLVINGDEGEEWDTASFACRVTARETTWFVITDRGEDGGAIDFECSTTDADADSAPEDLNLARRELIDARSGIFFVSVAQLGQTVSKNAIFGDATIFDALAGDAFSVGAIAFQGIDALNQDGDLQFRFDGLEYAEFPASLATDFLAPDASTTAELILFTLDGTADFTPVPIELRVLFYNDDETERDASFDFDCFAILPLNQIDPRLSFAGLGSRAGHITLEARTASVGTAHELTGTGQDGFRSSPAHGWIVQTHLRQGEVAASARTLAQSTVPHVPLAGDVVNLNAN